MKVGVLGGGQLAKMLAIAGKEINVEVLCVDPNPDCCAARVTNVLNAVYEDTQTIAEFFNGVNCVTVETENLPFDAVAAMANHFPLYPGLEAIRITQDRKLEKNLLKTLTIPTVKFQSVTDLKQLYNIYNRYQGPIILKTCQGGYDGKGQYVIQELEDAILAWNELHKAPIIAEQVCHFDKEISLITARNQAGQIVYYPLVENMHQNGILRQSNAPFENEHLTRLAQSHADVLLNHLNYVGVMTIEFFVKNNTLLVNEIAPRVHNSGHWTIEGAITSQFKNHLLAILNLPLESTEAIDHSSMLNIVSKQPESLPCLPGVYPHIYGKDARPNRKLGHVTLNASDLYKLRELVSQIQSYL